MSDPDFALDDVDMSTKELATTALDAATQAYMRRLEREAVGAHLAGFEALDVLTPRRPFTGNDDAPHGVTLQAAFIPRQSADSRVPDVTDMNTERYVLTELNAADIRAARRRWRNDHG